MVSDLIEFKNLLGIKFLRAFSIRIFFFRKLHLVDKGARSSHCN